MQQVEMVSEAFGSLWTVRQGTDPPWFVATAILDCGTIWNLSAAMLDDLGAVYRYDQRSCGRVHRRPTLRRPHHRC